MAQTYGEIVLFDRGRAVSRRFSGLLIEKNGQVQHCPEFAGRIIVPQSIHDSLWVGKGPVYGRSIADRVRLQLIGAIAGAAFYHVVAQLSLL